MNAISALPGTPYVPGIIFMAQPGCVEVYLADGWRWALTTPDGAAHHSDRAFAARRDAYADLIQHYPELPSYSTALRKAGLK